MQTSIFVGSQWVGYTPYPKKFNLPLKHLVCKVKQNKLFNVRKIFPVPRFYDYIFKQEYSTPHHTSVTKWTNILMAHRWHLEAGNTWRLQFLKNYVSQTFFILSLLTAMVMWYCEGRPLGHRLSACRLTQGLTS